MFVKHRFWFEGGGRGANVKHRLKSKRQAPNHNDATIRLGCVALKADRGPGRIGGGRSMTRYLEVASPGDITDKALKYLEACLTPLP